MPKSMPLLCRSVPAPERSRRLSLLRLWLLMEKEHLADLLDGDARMATCKPVRERRPPSVLEYFDGEVCIGTDSDGSAAVLLPGLHASGGAGRYVLWCCAVALLVGINP